MDEILQELTPVMKKEFPRRPPTNENLYSYYMTRVKWNLHVALCFSPVTIPLCSNIAIIKQCRYVFRVDLPSVQLQSRFQKFLVNADNDNVHFIT